ncbi:MAG: TIGR01212 family radical SAM protein [Campylobacterota bacterium]|nr:TIGR01212 family radical SAM protein [Campylobacterota bacterium]
MVYVKPLHTIGRYFKNKFGEKVYKVPVSISGFTCPNIDGTVAKGGCTFCENESFSPNLTDKSKFKLNSRSTTNPYLETQLQQMKIQFDTTSQILRNKFGANKFIVYFQSFTNTYAPLDTLKHLYEEALCFDNVVGLSIGTRTDCITEEILDYLVEISHRPIPNHHLNYEVWVEYGIQSFYDETLSKINRGHDAQNMVDWIKITKDKGLLVCGHLIYGLPDETQAMMLQSHQKTIDMGVDSVKYHPLYVVKNTLLTKTFLDGKFTPISEELYIDTVVKSILQLPQNISIQRITAGIDDPSLLSPNWCRDKHQQMFNLKEQLKLHNLCY